MILKDSELGNNQIQEFKSYSHIYHQISLPFFLSLDPLESKPMKNLIEGSMVQIP